MREISPGGPSTRSARGTTSSQCGANGKLFQVCGAMRTARPTFVLQRVLSGRLRNSFAWLSIVPLPFALCGYAAGGEVDTNSLPPAAEGRMDFVRDIKPLLDNRCLKC